MSGDGDFERALEMVRSRGKRVAVVAYPDMTARELRNVVGRNYFDLRDLEQYIARTDRVPEPAQVTEGVPILRQGHSELPPHDDEE
jgi:uncharacterized LabA/DUF88 family protein